MPLSVLLALGAALGLVLLLVAALRALGDAAVLVGAVPVGGVLLVLGGAVVGAGTWLLVFDRLRVRGPVGALAVVLAQAPLLAGYAHATYDTYFSEDVETSGPPVRAVLLLAGLLAGGAVAAAGPGTAAAVAAVALLAGGLELARVVDPLLLRECCAGLAAAVLVPLLVERCRAASGSRVGQGALAGVALVLLAAAAPALLDTSPDRIEGMPRRYTDHPAARDPRPSGVPVPGTVSQAYASTLDITFDPLPPLVPGLSLLEPGSGLGSTVFGWFAYAPLQSNG